MLLYLLSSDELREVLDRLDYRFAPEQIPKMVDYYLARTSHGSTLSGVVHTWVLARANRDRAMEFFEQVLKSDIADIQGGTTSEGIHLAAMAGSVDLVQRCFTGLETRGDRMVLSPHWPESLGALGFPIHYRGHHVHVRVSGKAPRSAWIRAMSRLWSSNAVVVSNSSRRDARSGFPMAPPRDERRREVTPGVRRSPAYGPTEQPPR